MNQQQQDQQLNDWLERHQGLLLKVTRSFAATSHDRDDLLQDIVLQVWRSIPRYVAEVAESTWIYRVAIYTAVSWSRKGAKRREIDMELTHDPAAVSHSKDRRVDWLYEKIAEMKPIDRSIALLMLDGVTYREISAVVGISESNVGVRINRIKKQLTARLSQEREDEF